MKKNHLVQCVAFMAMAVLVQGCGRESDMLTPPPAGSLALVFINDTASSDQAAAAVSFADLIFHGADSTERAVQFGGKHYGIRFEVRKGFVTDQGADAESSLRRLRADPRFDGFRIFLVCSASGAIEIGGTEGE